MTALPHSSAAVERVFSQVNLVKTKHTNKLSAESVRDRLLAKQDVVKGCSTCVDSKPRQELIQDIADGTCHKRYQHRIEEARRRGQATFVEGVEGEDA